MPATSAATVPPIETALRYHREGRDTEAEAAYRAAMDDDPGEPNVPPLLGMLLLRSGRAAEAAPLLARAAALHPDDAEIHLAHANALYVAGQVAEAVRHYRALLERWPHKAAAWSNLAEGLRAQGQNDAALAATERALALLPGLAEAHLGRGNALLALGRTVEADAAYGAALAANPRLAAAEASRAAALLRLGRAAEAEAAAGRALEIAPHLAEAEFALGCALRDQRKRGAAIAAFETTVRLDPRHARAWLNLGNALAEADQFQRAEYAYRMALDCDPGLAEAHSSLGCLLSQQGQIEAAIEVFDRAIALKPDYAEAHWNQGFSLLLAGNFARGWEKYEWRKRHDRFAKTFPTLTGPNWEGEPVAGRKLLVHAEQGLGDTIQFVRYAPLLAAQGAHVVLACDRKLMPLLAKAPGVGTVVSKDSALPDHDLWVDQMSLPRIFATRLDSIPAPKAYLGADPKRAAVWAWTLPAGRKVGIVWAGNPGHSNDARRTMPVEALRPLLGTPDTSFFSLQVGPGAGEVARLAPGIVDLSPRLVDFAETAAAIANLDFVVTVDTAVAHLAGALGRPVWAMLPHAPDWRWLLGRGDTPWYASMRLFRQPAPGDWATVIERVAAELRS